MQEQPRENTNEASGSRYRIGELARLSGLTTRTLRYYEELKLICSERSSGGQRLFDERSLGRLHIIESLKIAGFSLQEIRHILWDWRDGSSGRKAAAGLLEMLQSKHADVTKTLNSLGSLKKQLEKSINLLDNCAVCSQNPEPDLCGSCEASQDEGRKSPLIDEILNN